jgi:hypothetical protein
MILQNPSAFVAYEAYLGTVWHQRELVSMMCASYERKRQDAIRQFQAQQQQRLAPRMPPMDPVQQRQPAVSQAPIPPSGHVPGPCTHASGALYSSQAMQSAVHATRSPRGAQQGSVMPERMAYLSHGGAVPGNSAAPRSCMSNSFGAVPDSFGDARAQPPLRQVARPVSEEEMLRQLAGEPYRASPHQSPSRRFNVSRLSGSGSPVDDPLRYGQRQASPALRGLGPPPMNALGRGGLYPASPGPAMLRSSGRSHHRLSGGLPGDFPHIMSGSAEDLGMGSQGATLHSMDTLPTHLMELASAPRQLHAGPGDPGTRVVAMFRPFVTTWGGGRRVTTTTLYAVLGESHFFL